MMRIYTAITGDRFENVQQADSKSRKKVMALAIVTILPTMVWLVMGFAIPYNFYGLGIIASSVIALISASIVFLTERMIVLSDVKNKKLAFLRLMLALSVAVIGGSFIDLMIFQEDIQKSIAEENQLTQKDVQTELKTQFQKENAVLLGVIDQLRYDVAGARQDYISEADGTGGSGRGGVGSITALKQQKANQLANELREKENELEAIQLKQNNELNVAMVTAIAGWNSNSTILHQGKHLLKLAFENGYTAVKFLAVCLIGLLLEMLPVLLKKWWDETAYEKRLRISEEVLKIKEENRLIFARRMHKSARNAELQDYPATMRLLSNQKSNEPKYGRKII